MKPNIAKLLNKHAGRPLVLEWEDGLRLRATVDTFTGKADNRDGLDSIDMKVEKFFPGRFRGRLQVGAWLEVKENEALVKISTPSGNVIWSARWVGQLEAARADHSGGP